MSDDTKIEWTNHTFNPWWGCSRVSPACRFCYADRDAQRYGFQVWRRHGERRMLSEANWQRPLKWNRDAEKAGVPAKVFCASMADVFEDHPQVTEARNRLWNVIEVTPWLQWQLLTKRPENVAGMVPWGDRWPSWVWLGTSVENQRFAEQRIPYLLAAPAAVLFLSCEPLLGPVDLGLPENHSGHARDVDDSGWGYTCLDCSTEEETIRWLIPSGPQISWVIVGGESGPKARKTELVWIEEVVNQCHAARVSVFVKQFGKILGAEFGAGPKGGDIDRWPAYLQHRHFPRTHEQVTA